jgi:hypothetical protein
LHARIRGKNSDGGARCPTTGGSRRRYAPPLSQSIMWLAIIQDP